MQKEIGASSLSELPNPCGPAGDLEETKRAIEAVIRAGVRQKPLVPMARDPLNVRGGLASRTFHAAEILLPPL